MVRSVKSFILLLGGIFAASMAVAMLGSLGYIALVVSSLPQLPENLVELDPPGQTVILDRSGIVIARMGSTIPVSLDQISPMFIDALLSTEDADFYKHSGINKKSIIRIVIEHLTARGKGGGSTLTQQLAKNLFFSFEKKVDRKLREMLLTAQLEALYEKDEILQAYCNTVNFGSGSLGIESASWEYFGKPAIDLDIVESATLVAALNAPGRFHPRIHPDRNAKRRTWILGRMLSCGKIGLESKDILCALEPEIVAGKRFENGHLRDYVLAALTEEYKDRALDSSSIPYAGLVIRTSIDLGLQEIAQREVSRICEETEERLGKNSNLQGVFVAVDPRNGEILTMVGGRDYSKSAFNCATSSNRQPGSSFKPLLYYTALRAGLSPLDVMNDSLITHDIGYNQSWSPRNWNDECEGPMSLAYSIMKSKNTIAAQLVMDLGTDELIKNAKSCGIKAEIKALPSLALGALEVSPLEQAVLFSCFVNRGIRSEAFVIRQVEDRFGKKVLGHQPDQKQVLDPVESYLVLDMLKGAVKYGTGRGLLSENYPGELGGKTGTTNDYRDSWFCAVTPSLSTVSWIGNEDNSPMRFNSRSGVTGAGGAMKVFKALLSEIERLYYDESNFRVPDGIEFRNVELTSGLENETGVPLALRMIDY
jgi:membrane peptidoglycan carboxypeptidase